jgi:crotonobetainyl-CoA:carnitine CoA-transferase CaiB-like acyl-CoA transferase
VSLFGSAAELMSVPYLQARYGGKAPKRVGLKHPSIAPYGGFTCADGRDIVISIQNEREWADFCNIVLRRPDLLADERCKNNASRVKYRDFVDGTVADIFDKVPSAEMIDRLTEAQTAFGQINSVHDLIAHPQLLTKPMKVKGKDFEIPVLPWMAPWDLETFAEAPQLDEHGYKLRNEFAS